MSESTPLGHSYGLGPELDVSNFNIVLTILGGFLGLLGLVSYVVKEKLYISDSLIATLLGVAFGPIAAHFVRPDAYGNVDEITLPFTRLVIGIQLVLAGIQLPSLYIVHQWKSLAMLLLPVMTAKWLISALVIWLVFPSISYLEALAIGACITPTDPVLANAIVKGRYAEQYVPEHLRDIISAEAGANDGFGYPFLFLAISLLKVSNRGAATADWFVHVWLYEIILSVVYGCFVGLIARYILKYALRKKWVDEEFFLAFFLSLSLLVIGTCGMLGTDDLLAAFIAGNAFSYRDFYRDQTSDDSLQTTLDTLLNLTVFLWLGATMPWSEMASIDPGWRLFVTTVAILIFGRLPVMLALWKWIPEVRTWQDATFAGWFGPVGVGAIFYVQIALPYFDNDPTYELLYAHLKPVVYAMALSSIAVHGITVPVVRLGQRAPATMVSMSRAVTKWTQDAAGSEPGVPKFVRSFTKGTSRRVSRAPTIELDRRGSTTPPSDDVDDTVDARRASVIDGEDGPRSVTPSLPSTTTATASPPVADDHHHPQPVSGQTQAQAQEAAMMRHISPRHQIAVDDSERRPSNTTSVGAQGQPLQQVQPAHGKSHAHDVDELERAVSARHRIAVDATEPIDTGTLPTTVHDVAGRR